MSFFDIFQDATKTAEDWGAQLLHRLHQASEALPPIEFDDQGWAHGENVTCFRIPPSTQAPAPTFKPPNELLHPLNYMGDTRVYETRKQQALASMLRNIAGITWHYTDTRGCGADKLAQRLLDPTNTRAASWHACVDELGHIAQSVSAHCGAWHAGGSDAALFYLDTNGDWQMVTQAQRGQVRGYSANSCFYGIELENAGELRCIPGPNNVAMVWASWPFAFGTQYGPPIIVPEVEVVKVPGSTTHGWHRFTPEQIAGATRLVNGLVGRYGLKRAACSWTHSQIDPKNRVDPGKAWCGFNYPSQIDTSSPLGKILDAAFGTG